MSTTWILGHKLAMPVPSAPRIARPFERAAGNAPVTMLVGGPGYGKTLGLLGLVEQAQQAGALVVWLGLEPLDAEPATFLHYLVFAMRSHVPAFGVELVKALQEGLDPRTWLVRFFQEVASYNTPGLVIALDDAHCLFEADGALGGCLGYVFDKLPPGVRLALSLRRRWPLPLGRLVARGIVHAVEQAELAFSPAEIGAFFASRAADAAQHARWLQAAEPLEGWPLGLDLVARGSAPADPTLTRYLAEEVFQAQQPACREALLSAALLPALDPETCRVVLERSDAASWLDSLEADQLIVRLVAPDDGVVSYRFPTYLREFLASEALRALPAAAREALHRRAAMHFDARGRHELALAAWLAAQAWDPAAEACMRCFPAVTGSGRHGLIARSLAAFPAPLRESHPALLYWRAHACARDGRAGEAAELYRRAREASRLAHDPAGELRALVCESQIMLMQQDLPAFERLMVQARELAPAGSGEVVADMGLIQAMAADLRGEPMLVRQHNLQVLAVPIDHVNVAHAHVIAHLNLHTSHLHAGALAEAAAHAEQAVALATMWDLEASRLGAMFLLANLHLERGETDVADAIVRSLPPTWQAWLDWHDAACAHTVLGRLHQAQGDSKAAEDALGRSLEIFEEAGFKDGRKVPLERLMDLAIQRGHGARALTWFEAAGEVGVETYYDAGLQLQRARALQQTGRPAEALACLTALAPALQRQGAGLLLARSRLYEAEARQALAGPVAASAPADGPVAAPVPAPAGAPPHEALELRLFGGLEVRRGGRPVDLGARKIVKQIVAALALYPRGWRSVDLADALGDASPATIKVGLSLLRHALEPALAKGEVSRYVAVIEGRYALEPALVAACDVRAFESAIARGQSSAEADAAEAFAEALALYRGELAEEPVFEGCFEGERETCRQQALEAALRLASFHRRRGDFTAMIEALRRGTAIAPCDEAAYAAIMAHYAGQGRPMLARQAYWDCRKALKAHTGDAPSPELEAAYRQLPRGTGALVG